MTRQDFANHLGFNTWTELIKAAEFVAFNARSKWYVVYSPTWYKWVLWNTKFDMYFNHATKNEAFEELSSIFACVESRRRHRIHFGIRHLPVHGPCRISSVRSR